MNDDDMDPEVRRLAVEQEFDDTERVTKQKFWGQRSTSVHYEGPWLLDESALDPFDIVTSNPDDEPAYALEWVKDVIRGLKPELRRTYDLVMRERMTEEDAARELNISQPAVHYRLERIKRAVQEAAIERGMYQ